MLFFTLLTSTLAHELDLFSFRSPFMPDHSEKFHTIGDAIPLRKFIRLGPPRPRSSGGIQTSSPINHTSFETQIIFNSAGDSPSENIGLSLWFSEKPSPLGPIYGLSSTFRGTAFFVDVAKMSLFLLEVTEDLTIESVLKSESCHIDAKNKQSTVHIHVNGNQTEVWVKDLRMRKCGSIETSERGDLFFGISSFSGNSSNTAFDVLQVLTTELEDEEDENEKIKGLEKTIKEEMLNLDQKLQRLLVSIKDEKESKEIANVFEIIRVIWDRLRGMYLKMISLKEKVEKMNGKRFVESSNKEIVMLRDVLGRMNVKIENLMGFLNERKGFEEVRKVLDDVYGNGVAAGKGVERELMGVGREIGQFMRKVREDDRFWWMHFAFGILLGSVGIMFSKIIRIKKVKTIT